MKGTGSKNNLLIDFNARAKKTGMGVVGPDSSYIHINRYFFIRCIIIQ